MLAVVAAACSPPPVAKRPNAAGDPGAIALPADHGKAPTPGPAKPAPIVLKDIGCLQPTCAYHAGTNAYFTCLSGGAGTCFHFGAACTPAGSCMYDATSRGYKQCTKVVEGTCQAWAAACAPATKCMFDPASGLHHTCDDLSGGTCKRFGALCAP